MKKALKWIGIGVGSLVGLIVLAAVGLSLSINSRLNKVHAVQPEVVTIPTDAESLAEGERLASIFCAGCHGDDMSGTDFFNDPSLGVSNAPNLTAGKGGVGGKYGDGDWVHAIRHGVDVAGKPLFIMPSKDLYHLNDEDLGQIIAYLKNLPPIENEANEFSTTLMGRILLGIGAFGDVLNAETIDHDAPRPDAPVEGVSTAYGDYLVKTFGCRTCHGEVLSGGKDPNPDAPPGPNLTPGGNLRTWAEGDFINMVRNRKSEWMPFESLSKMTDDELSAIWQYLESLPELKTTTK